MYSATVAIPHVNTYPLLELCLACIFKHPNPLVDMRIIIVDQSDPVTFQKVVELARSYDPEGSKIIVTPAQKLDAGYPIDVALKMASGSYFCCIHCDCFAINKNWLYLPIHLISHGHAKWVGVNTRLDWAYKHKGPFYHLNSSYRVCETDLARRVSETVGFMRPTSRRMAGFTPTDTSWEAMPEPHECDNCVIAQWWVDQQCLGPKLALARIGCVGMTPDMGAFGDNMEDMMLHLVFAESFDRKHLGDGYNALRDRIDAGITPDDVLELHRTIKRECPARRLDGELIASNLYDIIEKIKTE